MRCMSDPTVEVFDKLRRGRAGTHCVVNHHYGRNDRSPAMPFGYALRVCLGWSVLLEGEWIGISSVGAHSDEVVVVRRGK